MPSSGLQRGKGKLRGCDQPRAGAVFLVDRREGGDLEETVFEGLVRSAAVFSGRQPAGGGVPQPVDNSVRPQHEQGQAEAERT